jgi:S-adenosylmethionine decarboxylase
MKGHSGENAIGCHILADFYGIAIRVVQDARALESTLVAAAQVAGAVPLESRFHSFGGGGLTGVVLLKESHISVHTWPEYCFAAVDVFMCGAARPRDAVAFIERAWRPRRVVVKEFARGEERTSLTWPREVEA